MAIGPGDKRWAERPIRTKTTPRVYYSSSSDDSSSESESEGIAETNTAAPAPAAAIAVPKPAAVVPACKPASATQARKPVAATRARKSAAAAPAPKLAAPSKPAPAPISATLINPRKKTIVDQTIFIRSDGTELPITKGKGKTLYEILDLTDIPINDDGTLLVVELTIKPSILPASAGATATSKDRIATVYVDYMSTSRISAMLGNKKKDGFRLCFKCLARQSIGTGVEGAVDPAIFIRNNPNRRTMEWHPLRMIMHATLPAEVHWHKDCYSNAAGNPQEKIRKDWYENTPGALFREIPAADGALMASMDEVQVFNLSSILPAENTDGKGSLCDYDAYVMELWEAGEELDVEGASDADDDFMDVDE